MWYIIWTIDSKVKRDVLGFETESQALKYANYYKSLLEIYYDSHHMQKRFGLPEKALVPKNRMKVSFQLTQAR